MRKRLFEIIEAASSDDKASHIYDIAMMLIIVVSVVPLAFKGTNALFSIIDKVSAGVFIIDYIFRWATADYKFGKKDAISFLRYPFSPMAIIDLISILPTVSSINGGFRLLKIFRLLRSFRVFRIFKAMRYSKNIRIIVDVLRKQKDSLTTVFMFAMAYILISALLIFNVEPETFETFFDAVYWATISLTTMGYGDIYPISTVGRVVTMLSSLVGIAVVALPASIITAGYMEAVNEDSDTEAKEGRK